jgi:hypothetical protein
MKKLTIVPYARPTFDQSAALPVQLVRVRYLTGSALSVQMLLHFLSAHLESHAESCQRNVLCHGIMRHQQICPRLAAD